MKRVDFDVHFVPDERSKQRLAAIFAQENPIFRWFSHLYLKCLLNVTQAPHDDELHTVRVIMKDLYERANRQIPEFFPSEPLERLYDPGHREWENRLALKKARIERARGRTLVHFSDDMQPYEFKEYEAYLPQTVKYRRRGNTLDIETPDEFTVWLEGQLSHHRSLLGWLKGILGR